MASLRDWRRSLLYYWARACVDGFVALACLNTAQRLQVCELLGLDDVTSCLTRHVDSETVAVVGQ